VEVADGYFVVDTDLGCNVSESIITPKLRTVTDELMTALYQSTADLQDTVSRTEPHQFSQMSSVFDALSHSRPDAIHSFISSTHADRRDTSVESNCRHCGHLTDVRSSTQQIQMKTARRRTTQIVLPTCDVVCTAL